jgi:hypothetical protein
MYCNFDFLIVAIMKKSTQILIKFLNNYKEFIVDIN